MPSTTRLALAVIRAAVPIVGVFLLGWKLGNVLFFFWFELVTAGLYVPLVGLRELAARARTGKVRWLGEGGFILVAAQIPALIVAVIVMNMVGADETWAHVSGLVAQPDMRLSMVMQLMLAVAGALAWSPERDPEAEGVGSVIELQFSRMIVVGASLLPMLLVVLLVFALAPPPLAKVAAERTIVVVYAILWAAGDAAPERFHRFAQWVMRRARAGRRR
jgi:hypothetical protein